MAGQSGRRGASGLTYGILVGLVAVVAIGAVDGIGGGVNRLFGRVAGRILAAPAPAALFAGYSFALHSFTPCGATGRDGPSQTQCVTAYSSAPWRNDPAIFSVTAGTQLWAVPATGRYRLTLAGAQGGNGRAGAAGGKGAEITADVTLTLGQKLQIRVGQRGIDGPSSIIAGGGGGGGSVVLLDGASTPLVVAGGGGGGSYLNSSQTGYDGLTGTSGGASARAGGSNGTGGATDSGEGGGRGAGGGGWTAAGTTNSWAGGGASQLGQGGGNGDPHPAYAFGGFGGGGAAYHGGGGGGGYSGGGGGSVNGRGGGGGGSFTATGVTLVDSTAGARSGDGVVTISFCPSGTC